MRRHENHAGSNALEESSPNRAQRPLDRIQRIGVDDMRNDVNEGCLKHTLRMIWKTDPYGDSCILLRNGFKNERVAIGY